MPAALRSARSPASGCITLRIRIPLCFFFYCYRHHRYLHSFPTRRSSDLIISWMFCAPFCGSCVPFTVSSQRSEEHTSELQSPYDLVCRLLLEKKNTSRFMCIGGKRPGNGILALRYC